jgi:hypothetical protein
MALHALPEVYSAIKAHRTTLVFVNTRTQAELAFRELWRLNDDNLPIGLHHGGGADRGSDLRRRASKLAPWLKNSSAHYPNECTTYGLFSRGAIKTS